MSSNDLATKQVGRNNRPVAAITGASSGLGRLFAERLAARGYDLILVARRQHLLEQFAADLEEKYRIVVESIPADLAQLDDLRQVEERFEKTTSLRFLVNSAGFGDNHHFPDVDVETETKMILLHCLASMRLTRAALIPMVAQRHGRIINISSAAGFLAGDGCADYCATKAYLITFSKCVQSDVRKKGVRVQALCPGFVKTGFHDSDSMKNSHIKQNVPWWLWSSADRVVNISLKAIERRWFYRVVCIPTLLYKAAIYFGSEWYFSPLRMLFTGGRIR